MPPYSSASGIYDSSISSVMPDPGSLGDLGLPSDPSPAANPALITTSPDQTQNSGLISKIDALASNAVSTFEAGLKDAGRATENVIATGYNAGKTVASDVVGGVKGVVSFGVTQIVIVVAVAGVALYFIGKTGAFKVSAIV